jgi:photosynthetic reaction center cytochrome c subunit
MKDDGLLSTLGYTAALLGGLLFIAFILNWERPPVQAEQGGFRGVAMGQLVNPRTREAQLEANQLPAVLPPLPAAGPKAGQVYKNVKILGDLSVGQFTRLMASITTWVAPTQGCAYCHNTDNMADDGLYTKIVARRMIQMVQHVNADWKPHVAATGVTCYTCHRGQPVPANIWFNAEGPRSSETLNASVAMKNLASPAVGLTSLPYDPFTAYLERDDNIRVQGPTALPTGNTHTIKETEWTYALMVHMSTSLGVNCTYCHNSREFSDWSQSTPKRVTAWHGIRMVRDLNTAYLDPLGSTFPANRLGPTGDSPKVNCATCHNGVYKPLFGQSQIAGFPELAGPPK